MKHSAKLSMLPDTEEEFNICLWNEGRRCYSATSNLLRPIKVKDFRSRLKMKLFFIKYNSLKLVSYTKLSLGFCDTKTCLVGTQFDFHDISFEV